MGRGAGARVPGARGEQACGCPSEPLGCAWRRGNRGEPPGRPWAGQRRTWASRQCVGRGEGRGWDVCVRKRPRPLPRGGWGGRGARLAGWLRAQIGVRRRRHRRAGVSAARFCVHEQRVYVCLGWGRGGGGSSRKRTSPGLSAQGDVCGRFVALSPGTVPAALRRSPHPPPPLPPAG